MTCSNRIHPKVSWPKLFSPEKEKRGKRETHSFWNRCVQHFRNMQMIQMMNVGRECRLGCLATTKCGNSSQACHCWRLMFEAHDKHPMIATCNVYFGGIPGLET